MTPEQTRELCEHLEGASAALEMALQTIDKIRDADNLTEWKTVSEVEAVAWQAQRDIDRIMAKLTDNN